MNAMAQDVDRLVIVRGGGDLATGVVWRLRAAGLAVLVTEVERPLAIRRTVSLASAVAAGTVNVEGMIGERIESHCHAAAALARGTVPVLVSPALPRLRVWAVVDARMPKANHDTTLQDAGFVVGLGPGFSAGEDCHAVIETLRGPRLGRVIWNGPAAADTGVPGELGGHSADRVVRSPMHGVVDWAVDIGDVVCAGQSIGLVGSATITAPFAGTVRGLIAPATRVNLGMKIADVDPRRDVAVHEISDKALAVGGGAVEAILSWSNGTAPQPGSNQCSHVQRAARESPPTARGRVP